MYVKARLVKWSALNQNCFSEYQTARKHFSRRRRSPSVQALWCWLASPPGSQFLVECNVACFVLPRLILCVCSNRASGDMVFHGLLDCFILNIYINDLDISRDMCALELLQGNCAALLLTLFDVFKLYYSFILHLV